MWTMAEGRRRGRKVPSEPSNDEKKRRRQRLRRLPVAALVTVNADSEPLEATTCDVSETGLKISIEYPLALGPVTVKMVGFPIFSGEVRWQAAGQYGIELLQPIPDDFLTSWIKMHGAGLR
jgi:hypothetical protein